MGFHHGSVCAEPDAPGPEMSAVECGSTGERRLKLAGGGTLGFREYGDPDGAPLIFLHGWPSSSGQGIFLDGIGKARGLRVLSLDRPGFGASSFMPDRGFLHLPPLVEELAEALGLGKCYVLGVSGGGPYALACAYALPHRVRQAVVCGGAPPLGSEGARTDEAHVSKQDIQQLR